MLCDFLFVSGLKAALQPSVLQTEDVSARLRADGFLQSDVSRFLYVQFPDDSLRADGDDEELPPHRKRTNSRRLTGKAGQPQRLVPRVCQVYFTLYVNSDRPSRYEE